MQKYLALPLLAFLYAACQPVSSLSEQAKPKPVATLQQLMQAVIDPHVDPIWQAVSTTVTQAGVVEKAPASAEEWASLRQHALTLIEVANLLVVPNRLVATSGASTSIHPTELDPKAIASLIAEHPEDFAKKAFALQQAAGLALAAIDAKQPERLLKAGESIEQACEACHAVYWYPNDQHPLASQDLIKEGLGRQHAGYFKPWLHPLTIQSKHVSVGVDQHHS